MIYCCHFLSDDLEIVELVESEEKEFEEKESEEKEVESKKEKDIQVEVYLSLGLKFELKDHHNSLYDRGLIKSPDLKIEIQPPQSF